jgi:hypothetical protein
VKEKPILFNGEMVRAILEGRKTQTRRVVKPQPPDKHDFVDIDDGDFWFSGMTAYNAGPCPYGQPGDRLWVRETWMSDPYINSVGSTIYRATETELDRYNGHNWKPSIFMPRVRSRLTLEIVRVRVERLQRISEEDALSEGTRRFNMPVGNMADCPSYRDAYKCLWESINGKGSWAKNTWIWVIEFTVQHPARSQSPEPSSEQCPVSSTPSGTPDTSPSVPQSPSGTPPSVPH